MEKRGIRKMEGEKVIIKEEMIRRSVEIIKQCRNSRVIKKRKKKKTLLEIVVEKEEETVGRNINKEKSKHKKEAVQRKNEGNEEVGSNEGKEYEQKLRKQEKKKDERQKAKKEGKKNKK